MPDGVGSNVIHAAVVALCSGFGRRQNVVSLQIPLRCALRLQAEDKPLKASAVSSLVPLPAKTCVC